MGILQEFEKIKEDTAKLQAMIDDKEDKELSECCAWSINRGGFCSKCGEHDRA